MIPDNGIQEIPRNIEYCKICCVMSNELQIR